MDVQLQGVVDDLVNHTQGAIPREQITALVNDVYDEMAADAKVQSFLPVLVGRAAMRQLQDGLPEARSALANQPEILIVCTENAGRSQAAAALFRHYAPGVVRVESAGMRPADHIQDAVVNILAEYGLHLTDEAKPLTPEVLQRAEHIVVIGDTGIEGEQWDLPELDGLPHEEVEAVLVSIDGLVRGALGRWLPDLPLGKPVIHS